MKMFVHSSNISSSPPSRSFVIASVLLVLFYASIMSRDINEPFHGLHSWGQAHTSWLARAHVNYGLEYTRGLLTWAVGYPPKEDPSHYLDHPQLSALLNAASFYIFGINDWSQRLVALVVSAMSLVLLLLLLRRIYCEETALAATLIYILFPITGYFFWVSVWMLPMILLAIWSYVFVISGLEQNGKCNKLYLFGLGVALFVIVQLSWAGFLYAAAIGTHYVLMSFVNREMPNWKLFFTLLLSPIISFILVLIILIAARDWNVKELIEIYEWRSTLSNAPSRTTSAWWLNFFVMMKRNFTLPVLFVGTAYIVLWLVRLAMSFIYANRLIKPEYESNSDDFTGSFRQFRFAWIFLVPGLLYISAFTEAMWVHHYQYQPFSLFLAIITALAILQLKDIIGRKYHKGLANFITVILFLAIFVQGTIGLNYYHDLEWYPSKQIDMLTKLRSQIHPSQQLLSYESHVVLENPAKGAFYRPETAWYLDREIVVARSVESIKKYAASGQYPYYLIGNSSSPIISELKNLYPYEYVQGRPGDHKRVGMSSYHIFDLRSAIINKDG